MIYFENEKQNTVAATKQNNVVFTIENINCGFVYKVLWCFRAEVAQPTVLAMDVREWSHLHYPPCVPALIVVDQQVVVVEQSFSNVFRH